ncbi:MAG: MlaD family protein [Terracidiphilus sp.]|nr:MlaD family protein [Terracidiphilus sp.]
MSRIVRLGVFIVVTLAVLATGMFMIGSKAYLFRSTYRLKAQFADVAGLAVGADVRVGGVHSGTVRSIDLPHQTGQAVTVVMDLDHTTHEIVKQDSVASIETEGLLGSQYMAISFGSAGQREVSDGDTIQSKPPLEMADLLIRANSILSTSQRALDSASDAAAHLSSVSAKIDSGQGSVGALINDRDIYVSLAQSTATLQTTMVQAQAGVADFRDNMQALQHNFLLRGYFKRRGYGESSDLVEDEIDQLPTGTPLKTFTYSPKQLFGDKDAVQLHNQQTLNECGEFLAKNEFGAAVIVISSGMEGDTQKQLVLTQVRAMLIRDYLVQHYGFDDNQLKTMALGKKASGEGTGLESIEILIYPVGTAVPAKAAVPAGAAPK